MTTKQLFKSTLRTRSAMMAATLALVACGDDDTTPDPTGSKGDGSVAVTPDSGTQTTNDAGANNGIDSGVQTNDAGTDSAAPAVDPVYIVAMRVWAPGGSFIYIKASRDLNVSFSPADYANSLEVGPYAGVTVQNGYVIVGESERPFATKYEITPDLKWKKVGDDLNFSTYFMGEDPLNDFTQIKNGNDQLFFYGSSGTARVHWKVDEWKIINAYTDTTLPLAPAGWTLRNDGNRTGTKDFKDAVVWPFVLSPDDGLSGVPQSFLAVYDGKTYAEKTHLEPSCPELNWSTKDEDGNLYFSTRERSPLWALYKTSAPNCVVKVKPDGTVDSSFGVNGEKTFTDLTGGKQAVAFKYLAKGKGAVSVFEPAKLNATPNYDAAIDYNVLCETQYCGEGELSKRRNQQVYTHAIVDLATNTIKPVTGYTNPNHAIGDYRQYFTVDGRVLFMAYAAEKDPTLTMYEQNLDTGVATPFGTATFTPGAPGADDYPNGEWTSIQRVR